MTWIVLGGALDTTPTPLLVTGVFENKVQISPAVSEEVNILWWLRVDVCQQMMDRDLLNLDKLCFF